MSYIDEIIVLVGLVAACTYIFVQFHRNTNWKTLYKQLKNWNTVYSPNDNDRR